MRNYKNTAYEEAMKDKKIRRFKAVAGAILATSILGAVGLVIINL